MPLRDHFRPPTSKQASWEAFHGMWPAVMVQQLQDQLPAGYVAAPSVHLGAFMEIDVSAYETDVVAPKPFQDSNGGLATSLQSAAFPTVAVESEPSDEYEYAVFVYDVQQERTLVAAVEFVSPANKDRPQARNAFVGKCASLLKHEVAVSVVDLVTIRRFNLYAELLAFIGHENLAPPTPSPTYAASLRRIARDEKTFLEIYERPLEIGRPLPPIPLWLAPDLVLSLDLEASYEKACRDLRIA